MRSVDQFKKSVDFIDKDVVMGDWKNFVQDDIDNTQYIKGTTGGTSGKPMQLLMPRNRHVIELGSVHGLWRAFGFRFDTRAVLRNHKLSVDYTINPITKEFIFDGFELTDKKFEILYSVMKKNNIQYLQCYPSSGYEFAKFLDKRKCDVGFINAFFVSSENVQGFQRQLVKKIGIKYFSLYGHSEKLVMAGSCPYSDYYHLVPGCGYLELIDENNNVIIDEAVVGEIVGTTVTNKGFPLIRYKTGDFSEYININCDCGYKGMALKTIYGRWSGDKIYNHDGSFVTTTALNLHNDLYSVIDGLQYVQNKKGELLVNVVPGLEYDERNEVLIYEHFNSKLNEETIIKICHVKSVVRQENGKFLILLSGVKE